MAKIRQECVIHVASGTVRRLIDFDGLFDGGHKHVDVSPGDPDNTQKLGTNSTVPSSTNSTMWYLDILAGNIRDPCKILCHKPFIHQRNYDYFVFGFVTVPK